MPERLAFLLSRASNPLNMGGNSSNCLTLETISRTILMPAPEVIKELIERFRDNHDDYQSSAYKEYRSAKND
jgi:hypothetical protein